MSNIGPPPLTNYEQMILGKVKSVKELQEYNTSYLEEMQVELIERVNSLNIYEDTTEKEKIEVIARLATIANNQEAMPKLRYAAVAAMDRIGSQFKELAEKRQKELTSIDNFGLF